MKAIILAAGEGLRCRPLTLTRSKVMLPVANKPILEHAIYSLAQNGIKDIVLIVGYEKERIMDYFEDGVNFGVNITYIEQKAQLGTAHAIKQTRKIIEPEAEDFLVLNGDNIIEPKTISDLLDGHRGDATIVTFKMEHTIGYGVVIAQGKQVKRIVEKPRADISHLVNTGIYLFNPKIFKYIENTQISDNGEYAITDSLQQMIDDGLKVTMVPTRSRWLDAIHSWDLLKANSIILDKYDSLTVKGTVEEGAVIKGNVSIGKNTIIRSGSYIVGPAMIGENCEIGPDVVILPSTTIGNNASIGPFSQIKNSIIMNDARIESHTYISNSVIGSNNTIGSHFITDDKENIKVEMIGILHHADRLGVITGDDIIIGHRVLIKPGILIGAGCNIESGNIISRELPPNSTVV
ncbi:MAG: NTP transferase domain-containing protein [Methanosarcinaceae archaeon]|nr:NTP transferase domain-containing protein [Methanosarcinaceae archaeon]